MDDMKSRQSLYGLSSGSQQGLRLGGGSGLSYGGLRARETSVLDDSKGPASVEVGKPDDDQDVPIRNAVYRPGADDAYAQMTAGGTGAQFDPRRGNVAMAGLLRGADGYLEKIARWSRDDVGPAFDTAILDAASSGNDGMGRFLTGLRIVSTASSDAVSGAAAMGRLITSSDARNAFVNQVDSFLDDPVGNVGRAFNSWKDKAWYEQVEDVYKVFQSGAAGVGLAGKARSLFTVGVLDDLATLGPNSQRVVRSYQSAYDDAAVAFKRDLDAGNIAKPDNLNFTTWAGGQIDNTARADMNAFKQLSGMDDLLVNRRLNVTEGIKGYRIPDLFLPGERTVIDGTIGTKGLTTPQIQDFFNSGRVDRVILVSPSQKPITITIDQFRAGKK